jgi:predicted XRE-type DNA-binding protein
MIPPEKIARLFISLRGQIEMERGETLTNKQLAETLGTSERAISELMNAKRRSLEVGWLLEMLSMLPEEGQFDQLQKILRDQKS